MFQDDDHGPEELTEEESIAECKLFECRVDLSRANVCKGVEHSWPKLYYNVADFHQLPPRRQERLYKKMEKTATTLYTKYVDSGRMARRRERSLKYTHAYMHELRYCKNVYNRITGLGGSNAAHSTTADAEELVNSTQGSIPTLETVINTGKMSSGDGSNNTDENGNQYVGANVELEDDIADLDDFNDENDANSENVNVHTTRTELDALPKRTRKANRRSQSVIVRETSIVQTETRTVTVIEEDNDLADELVINLDEEDEDSEDEYSGARMIDNFTESEPANTQATDTQRSSEPVVCATPRLAIASDVEPATPNIEALRANQWVQDNYVSGDDDEDEDDEDEFAADFLTQDMLQRKTSTQQ